MEPFYKIEMLFLEFRQLRWETGQKNWKLKPYGLGN